MQEPFDKTNRAHRIAAGMKREGATIIEIAEALHKTPEWVAATLRHPDAIDYIQRGAQGVAGPESVDFSELTPRQRMDLLSAGVKPVGAEGRLTPNCVYQASKELFDRDEPKVNKIEENRNIILHLPAALASRLGEAVSEARKVIAQDGSVAVEVAGGE